MALKLIALDLDGTLTQHRTPLGEKNRKALEKLARRYRLMMAGAGTCQRIFDQMGRFPIDIIGGCSSFDLIPGAYGKRNSLERYLAENGLAKQEMLYIGDDYEPGGGDHDVYASDIPFLVVDHYEHFEELTRPLLNE